MQDHYQQLIAEDFNIRIRKVVNHTAEDFNIRIRKVVNHTAEEKEPAYDFSPSNDIKSRGDRSPAINSHCDVSLDNFRNPNTRDKINLINKPLPDETTLLIEASDKVNKLKKGQERKYFKTQNGKLQCIKCDKQYTMSSHVSRHYLRAHNDKDNSCSFCPYVAYDEYRLKEHINIKHSEKKFQCKCCGNGFQNELSYREHIMKVHNIICDKCKKSFVTDWQLGRHLTIDHKEAQYNCTHCNYASKDKHSFRIHLSRMHLREDLKCKFCHMTFQRERLQMAHVKKAHDNTCVQCPKVFVLKKQLDLHVKIDHEGKEKFHFCTICNKRYLNLDEHVQVNHRSTTDSVLQTVNERSKIYPCQHCNIKFKSKSLLEKHKNSLVVRNY